MNFAAASGATITIVFGSICYVCRHSKLLSKVKWRFFFDISVLDWTEVSSAPAVRLTGLRIELRRHEQYWRLPTTSGLPLAPLGSVNPSFYQRVGLVAPAVRTNCFAAGKPIG